MPSRSTFQAWVEKHDDFRAAIARAKQAGYDERAEMAVENAKNAKDAGLGRLALDAERWFLSKIDPRRFGDKLDVNHRGGVVNANVPLPDDPNEATRLYREAMASLDRDE